MRNEIEKCARDKRGNEIRTRNEIGTPMCDREQEGHGAKGRPTKGPERDSNEIVLNEITKQEPAPKNFLEERHHDNKPNEAHDGRQCGHSAMVSEKPWIKALETTRLMEKFLWCDPDEESRDRHREGETHVSRRAPRIISPVTRENCRAQNRLEGENPITRECDHPKRLALKEFPDDLANQQQRHEREERRDISFLLMCCAEHAEKAMNENRSAEATPEQLIKLLEIQLSAQRAKRQRMSANRTAWRVGGVLLILVGAIAALLILQYAMSELSARDGGARRRMETTQADGRNF